MQNPKITEIESKFEKGITRVLDFQNLTNVVVVSLDKFEKIIEGGYNIAYEVKTASTVKFAVFNYGEMGITITTENMQLQIPDPPKTMLVSNSAH
jgi:hypothetical protein